MNIRRDNLYDPFDLECGCVEKQEFILSLKFDIHALKHLDPDRETWSFESQSQSTFPFVASMRAKKLHMFLILNLLLIVVYIFMTKRTEISRLFTLPASVASRLSLAEFYRDQASADDDEEQDEWQNFDLLFFRTNTAVFLFSQKSISLLFTSSQLKFNMLANKHLKMSFKVELVQKSTRLLELSTFNVRRVSQYSDPVNGELSITDVNVGFSTFADFKENVSKIRLWMHAEGSRHAGSRRKPINVIIKESPSLPAAYQENVFICLEPSFLEAKDLVDLKWFFEMSARIGFGRIVVSNNSIPNTKQANQLFLDYKHLADVVPFHRLPNLVKPSLNRTYASHMDELTRTGEVTRTFWDYAPFAILGRLQFCIFTVIHPRNDARV